ncbi:double-strand break repair helicase AddA [Roseobacter ponti]|uniref:DNA 3'-5' helicase n=1 Tax=Roseobacter ponti TaxID=1891787 RepID=A0A858SP93_9RHOB|nr:double-strand break repair helicase AddA [Roseobacter ponti]QJF49712.1 double-strand break repair helicase AddA [Roseobacter ponti]
MTARDEATEAQIRAARPDASTWLAANAGSGKTRVLTDRVARLLLDGVEPQHILCLTYTKAAASEMQNRLFRRLGAWAMLEDAALSAALAELGIDGETGADRLRDARTLFARAIETPGGLKIQTIHSFCASLLRRFPLEARVSPQFTEIEDRAADLLRAEIVEEMAGGPDAALVAELAEHYSNEGFTELTADIVRYREAFGAPVQRDDLLVLFGQPPDLSAARLEAAVFDGTEQAVLDEAIPVMLEKGGNDATAAQKLAAIGGLNLRNMHLLETVFLYGKSAANAFGSKAGSFPTKPTRTKIAHLTPALDAFADRIADAREARLALAAAAKSKALHNFAGRFLELYAAEKLRRGWLDFDDLILKARALLRDPAVAAWVLFRIDGGIDHILVDEAQDTSPAQWDVIRQLAAEFYSGAGARGNLARTLFVVGDKKQSIYSFQGADPREFDRMESEFGARFTQADLAFQRKALAWSFRSSEAVLRLVDETFTAEEEAGFGADPHRAFKSDLPGRVDLWPLTPEQEDEDDRAWHEPLDRRGTQHHDVVLARQIADRIADMIATGMTIPDDSGPGGALVRRPLRAGDFLILVQRRGTLFSEIIRACKNADLPIAGADRLKVGGELAVRDLAALLAFLATPEDSLSLASALKSPLFGWSEQELFTLAQGRGPQHLWQVLRDQQAKHPETLAILHDLRASVDFLRPYDLVERILTRHSGRRKLLARLGAEAEDGINALLAQALAYERTSIPSLTGFLVWIETDDLEVKRQIDTASDQIRVMTVHGAKGLEAPVVILPDARKRDISISDSILRMEDTPVWKTRADDMPAGMSQVVDEMKEAQRRERLRLLYVALTRAEKWLIVAAAGKLSDRGESWYQMVEAALNAAGAEEADFFGMPVRRLSHGDWDALPLISPEAAVEEETALPAFFRQPAPEPRSMAETLSPSDLEGAKALPGETGRTEEEAKAYGTLVHLLLEHLAGAGAEAGAALALSLADGHPDAEEALAEARAVLATADLQFLFGDDGLVEVPVSADLGTRRVFGTIDRLIVTRGSVLIVDFKTNRAVPGRAEDCPEGLLRQMGAYAHALAQIYPDRRIETAILWTARCSLMRLPHEIVRDALARTPYLDAAAPGT